jgi:hypothetical protein
MKWFKQMWVCYYWIACSKVKSLQVEASKKISYSIQTMIKLVIWIDLNAQSLCMYQLWKFLILGCSICWEDSKDYKFVIFGHLVLKIWIKPANRRFDSIQNIDSNWAHKIWIIIALLDSRCSKDSNGISFVILDLQIKRYDFLKIWIKSDFKF